MEETYATKKIYSFRLVVKTEQFKTFHRVWSKQVINVHSSLAGAVGRCVTCYYSSTSITDEQDLRCSTGSETKSTRAVLLAAAAEVDWEWEGELIVQSGSTTCQPFLLAPGRRFSCVYRTVKFALIRDVNDQSSTAIFYLGQSDSCALLRFQGNDQSKSRPGSVIPSLQISGAWTDHHKQPVLSLSKRRLPPRLIGGKSLVAWYGLP
ncbi:hypothetical protein RRG08_013705 [Elysia crispata]|uniref:Uncharacterized protein n=1 Tax=Elysia crispata TaxID=231223 RepID=A0AAE0ZMF0_9GAST|nr:hypothetical protein RRG08_013705 [Elysia crispata]